jgi:hypothetical protein
MPFLRRHRLHFSVDLIHGATAGKSLSTLANMGYDQSLRLSPSRILKKRREECGTHLLVLGKNQHSPVVSRSFSCILLPLPVRSSKYWSRHRERDEPDRHHGTSSSFDRGCWIPRPLRPMATARSRALFVQWRLLDPMPSLSDADGSVEKEPALWLGDGYGGYPLCLTRHGMSAVAPPRLLDPTLSRSAATSLPSASSTSCCHALQGKTTSMDPEWRESMKERGAPTPFSSFHGRIGERLETLQ